MPTVRQLKPSSINIRTPRSDVASKADFLLFSFFPAHLPYASLPPDLDIRLTTAYNSARKIIIYALSAILLHIISKVMATAEISVPLPAYA